MRQWVLGSSQLDLVKADSFFALRVMVILVIFRDVILGELITHVASAYA
jgi:hypothetical protein